MTTVLDLVKELDNFIIKKDLVILPESDIFELSKYERDILNMLLKKAIHNPNYPEDSLIELTEKEIKCSSVKENLIELTQSLFDASYVYTYWHGSLGEEGANGTVHARYITSMTLSEFDNVVGIELNTDFIPFIQQQRELINVSTIM